MKRIGLIGGVSPESTVVYYRLINAAAEAGLGRDRSADMVIVSLDFGAMKALYAAPDWPAFKARVVEAARALEAAGCEVLGICSNTTQVAAGEVAAATDVPLVRMIDTLATALSAAGVSRPLLLGTPFVMTGDFYRPALEATFTGSCLIPEAGDRAVVDRVIFEELVRGRVLAGSRDALLAIIARGRAAGADAVILGCTELMLILDDTHTDLPVFDSTALHARALAEAALGAQGPRRWT